MILKEMIESFNNDEMNKTIKRIIINNIFTLIFISISYKGCRAVELGRILAGYRYYGNGRAVMGTLADMAYAR